MKWGKLNEMGMKWGKLKKVSFKRGVPKLGVKLYLVQTFVSNRLMLWIV